MKLLTKEIVKMFKEVGSQKNLECNCKEDDKNHVPGCSAKIICKFFLMGYTWYATEYNEAEKLFYGLVNGHEKELGYFSLKELEELYVRGLRVERDIYFHKGKYTLKDLSISNYSL